MARVTTLLFVDIVDSTATAESLGDVRWRELLGRFYAAVRADVACFGGTEVATLGDGLLATFDGPGDAARCGLSLQATVGRLGLTVRVGLHAAEIHPLGEQITGLGVHVGARVTSVATPGEVWLTRAVRELADGEIRTVSRGTHELRGLRDPWDLYAAV
jgi:class 3 adenylate cyclase